MDGGPKYSIIVPVYNRPDEVRELLESLTGQSYKNFEVLIVEDGSTITCEKVFEEYTQLLHIRYFFKPNSGPGPSRNFGFKQARGNYLVVFDSDCIIPEGYFKAVEDFLGHTPLDAWGGPDRGHRDFTILQQAMAFTMSSVFTTGGIRGRKKAPGAFQPRSFNMGISKEVFLHTGGFAFDRFAEDIEFSLRMKELGYRVGYIHEAFVYHKRRTGLKQFFWQVYNFGRGRVLVGRASLEPAGDGPCHGGCGSTRGLHGGRQALDGPPLRRKRRSQVAAPASVCRPNGGRDAVTGG